MSLILIMSINDSFFNKRRNFSLDNYEMLLLKTFYLNLYIAILGAINFQTVNFLLTWYFLTKTKKVADTIEFYACHENVLFDYKVIQPLKHLHDSSDFV